MAEYNFWDDRTFENNDDYFCTILNGYCLDQDCNNCPKFKEYEQFCSNNEIGNQNEIN